MRQVASPKPKSRHDTTETALKTLPKGWTKIDNATTAPVGYYWASNNKSRFSGEREIALIKISASGRKPANKAFRAHTGSKSVRVNSYVVRSYYRNAPRKANKKGQKQGQKRLF